jgi:hypothetical protein
MDIREFVRSALEQIIQAVVEADKAVEPLGAEISPPVKTEWANLATTGKEISHRGLPMREVAFDLAVTVTSATATEGEAGVAIKIITLKAGGKSDKSNEQTSRIQFSIPLTLPTRKPKGGKK